MQYILGYPFPQGTFIDFTEAEDAPIGIDFSKSSFKQLAEIGSAT
jgi:hypothetical protein